RRKQESMQTKQVPRLPQVKKELELDHVGLELVT
ncbi:unnamed protein product, partial [marine sediment metagenome]